MELCASRALSNAAPAPYSRLLPTPINLRLRASLPLNRTLFSLYDNSGAISCKNTSLMASMSEETPIEMSKFDGETSSRTAVVEDVPLVEKNAFKNSFQGENSGEDSPMDEQTQQPFGEFLDKLNLKLDTENSYSLFLYGGGALVSIWLLSAIVGAIDSIPLFPKLMEVVGLSYSLWFTTRYLIFKKNRDELAAKIEDLKLQVLGSEED